jgi:putative membrane protein insertion efficiency factor
VIARALVGLIRVYQGVHVAFFRGSCRFYPTCSHYAYQAIARHGLLKGGGMSVWRILRCQPFHPGGFDPVP